MFAKLQNVVAFLMLGSMVVLGFIGAIGAGVGQRLSSLCI